MDGAVCALLLPCHECRSASISDRAPADARTSSRASAHAASVETTASTRKEHFTRFAGSSLEPTRARHTCTTRNRLDKSCIGATDVPRPLEPDWGTRTLG